MGAFIFIIILVVLNIIVGCFLRGVGIINKAHDEASERYINEGSESDESNNRTSSN